MEAPLPRGNSIRVLRQGCAIHALRNRGNMFGEHTPTCVCEESKTTRQKELQNACDNYPQVGGMLFASVRHMRLKVMHDRFRPQQLQRA